MAQKSMGGLLQYAYREDNILGFILILNKRNAGWSKTP